MTNYRRLGVALIHYGFITPVTAFIVATTALSLIAAQPGAQVRVPIVQFGGLVLGAIISYLYRQTLASSSPYTLGKELLLVFLSAIGLTAPMGIAGVAFYLASDEDIPQKG